MRATDEPSSDWCGRLFFPRFNHGDTVNHYQKELFIMADKKYELGVLEAQWVKKALEDERLKLIRARTKETPGSEIHALRGKEVEALSLLIQKFT